MAGVLIAQFKARHIAAGTFTCEACGWVPPIVATSLLHGHHALPVECGGLNHDGNLVLLCPNDHALAHHIVTVRREAFTMPSAEGPATRDTLLAALRALRGARQ